ncbi:Transposon Ty3-I Gag-Pol poly [Paramuricea clavata]|uniref:Transposon Ty3-I Gag-Pol poly n=1 Tax=Paramuricea clavata TaxID=317549 RepID=A0A7D9L9J3_PARCT|nr:Transposon Ty3-I Gag-Pol poly [Paramuricea clavata]
MEKDDIIEKTEGPTPWVSPIVVVPKPKSPNDVRICVDMRAVNKAIQRERHITPTIDDVIADLNDAKVFSKLDLNQGYHQLELSEESRYVTTFSTQVGLRRYKRDSTKPALNILDMYSHRRAFHLTLAKSKLYATPNLHPIQTKSEVF